MEAVSWVLVATSERLNSSRDIRDLTYASILHIMAKDGSLMGKSLTGSEELGSESPLKANAMTPNYILEAPITAKDARRRGLPQQTSKLIVYFDALPSGNGDREEITFFSN